MTVLPFNPPAPPPDRGRLLSAKQVAAELFNGTVSERFVRRHVWKRVQLSDRKTAWFEADVREWQDARPAG